jgi:hypothetical protein
MTLKLGCMLLWTLGYGAALSACAVKPQGPASESTSATPPHLSSFSAVVVPVRDYPRVASEGKCAPIYRNDTHGMCIAAKPCRGYGIRKDDEQVACMCYLTVGGCDEKSRCDRESHGCVPDTEGPENAE